MYQDFIELLPNEKRLRFSLGKECSTMREGGEEGRKENSNRCHEAVCDGVFLGGLYDMFESELQQVVRYDV